MEIQGKVIVVLPERTGVSSKGEWKSQEFVIETHESYPHKMVFNVFGAERLERFNIVIGEEISVSFDIDAKEYNGRWFNSIRAFDVKKVNQAVVSQANVFQSQPQTVYQQPKQVVQQQAPVQTVQEQQAQPAEDDLPF